MKKLLFVVIVLVLLGVGGFLYLKSKKINPKTMVQEAASKAEASVFTSVTDALTKNLSLKCSYTDDQGQATTVYIKGGAIRSELTSKTTLNRTTSFSKTRNYTCGMTRPRPVLCIRCRRLKP